MAWAEEESAQIEEMTEKIQKMSAKAKIYFPIKRVDIPKIANFLGLKITDRQAIEAMLFCRGDKMEQSDWFSLEKLCQYLNRLPPWQQMQTSHS